MHGIRILVMTLFGMLGIAPAVGQPCLSQGPNACDDSNACTDDSCEESLGCVHVPALVEVCVVAGGLTFCKDAPHTEDVVAFDIPFLGGPVFGTVPPLACDEGNACTEAVCEDSVCEAELVDCQMRPYEPLYQNRVKGCFAQFEDYLQENQFVIQVSAAAILCAMVKSKSLLGVQTGSE